MLVHVLFISASFFFVDNLTKTPEYYVQLNLHKPSKVVSTKLNSTKLSANEVSFAKKEDSQLAVNNSVGKNFTEKTAANIVSAPQANVLGENQAIMEQGSEIQARPGATTSTQQGLNSSEITSSSEQITTSSIDLEGFLEILEGHKKYPYLASKRGIEGTTLVLMRLDKAGNLISATIESSSGNELLDKAALKAIQASCPYQHGTAGYVTVSVPIVYRLLD